MILFINGPFGVGKTTVARLLVQRVPDGMFYDPEIFCFVYRKFVGQFRPVKDYQDHRPWRWLFVAVARGMRAMSARTLVIPMTVWRREYSDPIVAGLRPIDPDLAFFRLTASKDVLVHRISSDLEDTGAYEWRMSHAEVCLGAFQDPTFGVGIPTDDLSPSGVTDEILSAINRRQASRLTTHYSRPTNR